MAKRARGAVHETLSYDGLLRYTENLEFILGQGATSKLCAKPGCRRFLIRDQCGFCDACPQFCVVCEPDQFATCERFIDGECGNFFCAQHGDVDGKVCDECYGEPED